jgi:hypothetical protein
METTSLIPEKSYFLKWKKSVKGNEQINNMVVLEGEFIRYYNAQYWESFNNYLNEEDDVLNPEPELFGTILTDNHSYIKYPFEHPLYPYNYLFTQNFGSAINIGLFKITELVNTIFKGKTQPYKDNNPYYFTPLCRTTLINTPRINYNETLIWVDLDKVETRPVINKMKILREKAVDSDYFKTLPTDVLPNIKDYLE